MGLRFIVGSENVFLPDIIVPEVPVPSFASVGNLARGVCGTGCFRPPLCSASVKVCFLVSRDDRELVALAAAVMEREDGPAGVVRYSGCRWLGLSGGGLGASSFALAGLPARAAISLLEWLSH